VLNTDGPFYSALRSKKNYSADIAACIESTVAHLLDNTTTARKPGMLLGKVQSGKTETFLGVVALAFDNGYDVAIVLTKGTKALTEQTYERIRRTYDEFRQQEQLQVYDIMAMPTLIGYELDQKLVVVAKKQKDNLRRLATALFERHPELARKRILIVDDEADYASIGFKLTKDERVEINKIAGQIDGIRTKLDRCDFLQVTATPYSLYLQPPDSGESDAAYEFEPTHPAFTVLVPEMPGYVGGDYYFGASEDEGRAAGLFHRSPPRNLKPCTTMTGGVSGWKTP